MNATIIYAEDEQVDHQILARAFNEGDLKCAVKSVYDGEEALKLLNDKQFMASCNDPVVVVTDIHMPNVDGFELLQSLKRCDELKHIPVFVLSTSRRPAEIDKMYELGAVAYVQKDDAGNRFEKFAELVTQYCREEFP